MINKTVHATSHKILAMLVHGVQIKLLELSRLVKRYHGGVNPWRQHLCLGGDVGLLDSHGDLGIVSCLPGVLGRAWR